MKNITVTVDDEIYRRSRIKAAEAGASVSAVVRSFLRDWVQGSAESEFDRLERLQEVTLERIRSRGAGLDPDDNLSREELHERDAVR